MTTVIPVTDPDEAHELRRILVDALTMQADRYDSRARHLRAINAEKGGMDEEVATERRLAETARRVRDQIRNGG